MKSKLLLSALFLLMATQNGFSQVCDDLKAEHSRIERQALEILIDHPFMSTAFAGCFGVGVNEYNKTGDQGFATGVFLSCSGAACLFASDGTCSDTARRWFTLSLRKASIDSRASKYGCSM